jgi:YVTN family beta-propeller protein
MNSSFLLKIKNMRKIYFIYALIIGSSFIAIHSQTKSNYKIANKFHLTGDEKWDYLYSDDGTGMLYVSHGSMVQIVNETDGKLIGTISGMKGVHGIAIVADLGKGYISSGKDTMVTVFDTKTFKVIKKITASGLGPDAIIYDPFSKKIFTCNGKSKNSTVIDPATDKIVATISLDGKPEGGVSDGKGKVYVNFEEESKICEINATTFKQANVWSLDPGEKPTGLALDNEAHRLFSACDNKIMVIVDAGNGKIISTVPIGEKVDGAAFDPELKCVYTSNGDGTLTVVKEENKDSFKVLENLPTQKGAKTITVNKKTHHIYLPTANFEAKDPGEKPKVIPGTFVILDIEPE